MRKDEALRHWRDLPEQPVKSPDPIEYKHRGTSYGADGIRIEGTRDFIDSVLANLKPLLDSENSHTRLALNYQQVTAREGKPNDFNGNWVCYVKVHERGHEAKRFNRRSHMAILGEGESKRFNAFVDGYFARKTTNTADVETAE